MVSYELLIMAECRSMVPRSGARLSTAVTLAMSSGLETRYGHVLEEGCGQEESLAAYVSILLSLRSQNLNESCMFSKNSAFCMVKIECLCER